MDKNMEPKYSQTVFERLREALDVIVTDDAIISGECDLDIKPNYEIRSDGVWIKTNTGNNLFDWTPVCDLEESPDSPNPQTTPALPFPFTARQLAAFMFYGWGASLAERFAGHDGKIDEKMVELLLGGAFDVKIREAIRAAFIARAEAEKNIAKPDSKLEEDEQKYLAAYNKKSDDSNLLHNWREDNITEAERNERVNLRNKAIADKKAAYQQAKEANEMAWNNWRKAVVRLLLKNREQNHERPMLQESFHQKAIIDKIKELGYTPNKLHKQRSGKPGVKKQVRDALPKMTDSVFNKAWKALRSSGEIAEE